MSTWKGMDNSLARKTIKNVLEVVNDSNLDCQKLSIALKQYHDLLKILTGINLENQENKTDIAFENGVAIGLTWAAMCVDDLVRTRMFIRGVYEAVEVALQNKKDDSPVSLLYAGSGPYATLVLPLFEAFSTQELQVTIIEINETSAEKVVEVFNKLGYETYLNEVLVENAVEIDLSVLPPIDVVVSETMQHALVKEQQVPIMLNMYKQLGEKVIYVPQNISLQLSLLKTAAQLRENEIKSADLKKVRSLYDLTFGVADKELFDSYEFDLKPLRELIKKGYSDLCVSTEIQTYNNNWIRFNESGLTIPKILEPINDSNIDKFTSVKYVLDENPHFELG